MIPERGLASAPRRRRPDPGTVDAPERRQGSAADVTPTAAPRPQEQQEQQQAAGATWLTPLKSNQHATPRTAPDARSLSVETMPSFVAWLDAGDGNGSQPSQQWRLDAPLTAPSPRAHKGGKWREGRGCSPAQGVDVSDLAQMYDPQIAAASPQQPMSPVEKALARGLSGRL